MTTRQLIARVRQISPDRPLRTLWRSTGYRLRPPNPVSHQPIVTHRQEALIASGGARHDQRPNLLCEIRPGQTPTIIIGGFVPDATEALYLQRGMLLRHGSIFYVNYAPGGFSMPLLFAQLDDMLEELALRGGVMPVLVGLSFGCGLILEWMRHLRRLDQTARVRGVVLISPVTCPGDILDPGMARPATLLGRALHPFMKGKEVDSCHIEKCRSLLLRMFESGAQNKRTIRMVMTPGELLHVRHCVVTTLKQITMRGAVERVAALAAMEAPGGYYTRLVTPLCQAPVLILFAEKETSVLTESAPVIATFGTHPETLFPSVQLRTVVNHRGSPVQHASMLFHCFNFSPHLSAFYRMMRNPVALEHSAAHPRSDAHLAVSPPRIQPDRSGIDGLLSMPLRVGARILGARTRRLMAHPDRAPANQSRILSHLLAGYARSRLGSIHGIGPGMSYEDFAACVPLRTFEGFAPHIDRLRDGARDELWPGPCRFLALSSGTTSGPSKYLPVNAPMLEHFRQAGLQSLLLYSARTGRADIFDGRHLFLGGATALQTVTSKGGNVVYAGDLSGITAMHLPRWAKALLYEPGADIALIDDWPRKIEAIVARTFGRDIRLVAGIPSWLLVLFEALAQRARTKGVEWRGLRSIWPRLGCLVHGGVPVEPYATQLRAFTGPDVDFHEVFPASEAFIAAQDETSGNGLRLLDNAGIFYEFLPTDQIDGDGQPAHGAVALPLARCRPGVDYALALSNPGGLCRYLIGDIVRFLSIAPPRLHYVGRTRLQLSAFGEHVLERELTQALVQMSEGLGLTVAHFHVAPAFADAHVGRARGAHEWYIELTSGQAPVDSLAPRLDLALQQLNDDYAGKRRGHGLAMPLVRLMPSGTFETWLRSKGRWGGQSKMPRCRSDRLIADELARLSQIESDPPALNIIHL